MFKVIIALVLAAASLILAPLGVHASPYGVGLYNANVPYGGITQMSIATSGNVGLSVTPGSGPTLSSASGTVTVTTSDVLGYKLYIRALSNANLIGTVGSIPASGNSVPSSLALNTWGYSLDSGTTYSGLTGVDVLIRTTTTPSTSGSVTSITYGASIDNQVAAGLYSTNVVYTAVPQTY